MATAAASSRTAPPGGAAAAAATSDDGADGTAASLGGTVLVGGGVDMGKLEDKAFVAQFTPLRQPIADAARIPVADGALTAKNLARRALEVQQCSEHTLGRFASRATRTHAGVPRLPATLFRDFQPGGGLQRVLLLVLAVERGQAVGFRGVRDLDLLNISSRPLHVRFLRHLYAHLSAPTAAGGGSGPAFTPPRVCFRSSSVPRSEQQELAETVRRHAGTVVQSEADATHVVVGGGGGQAAMAALRGSKQPLVRAVAQSSDKTETLVRCSSCYFLPDTCMTHLFWSGLFCRYTLLVILTATTRWCPQRQPRQW